MNRLERDRAAALAARIASQAKAKRENAQVHGLATVPCNVTLELSN